MTMSETPRVSTVYFDRGEWHTYATKTETPHHAYLRSRFPARTVVGTVHMSTAGFGLYVQDREILSDGFEAASEATAKAARAARAARKRLSQPPHKAKGAR